MKYGFLILLLLAPSLQADVYKSTTADGEVVFSDKPSEGSERVRLPALTTYESPPVIRTPGSTPDQTADAVSPYKSFKVSKPKNDESIWDNEGIVTLSLSVEPALLKKSGHSIQYFLNGKPDGEPEMGHSHTYRDIERGTHTLSAAVVDTEGSIVISADPVTIHLHKASVLHPNNPLNTANQPPANLPAR